MANAQGSKQKRARRARGVAVDFARLSARLPVALVEALDAEARAQVRSREAQLEIILRERFEGATS